MRVIETAHWLERQDWANLILKGPFPVRDGRVEIANRHGVGIEWMDGRLNDIGFDSQLSPCLQWVEFATDFGAADNFPCPLPSETGLKAKASDCVAMD